MNSYEIDGFLQRLVESKSRDPMRRMMSTHLSSGGKRLRSNLVFECVAALGGNPESATGAAAACELLHNATLIHDDVQDGDRVRRGLPTLWVTDGINQAINSGDLMLMLPFSAIAQMPVSEEVKWKIGLSLSEAAQRVVMGQALEPGLVQHLSSPELMDHYLTCIRGKTASLFAFTIESACLVTEKTTSISELSADFEKAGVLFQIQDDVLDLYGNKGRGRAGEDLREGKISMLVVQYLKLHPENSAELISLLAASRENTSDADVAKWINKFRDEGALKATLEYIRQLEREIQNSKALANEEKLQVLMKNLIAKVLEPINDLL
jgi:geranylgeranyl diphosphate synthase, type I